MGHVMKRKTKKIIDITSSSISDKEKYPIKYVDRHNKPITPTHKCLMCFKEIFFDEDMIISIYPESPTCPHCGWFTQEIEHDS